MDTVYNCWQIGICNVDSFYDGDMVAEGNADVSVYHRRFGLHSSNIDVSGFRGNGEIDNFLLMDLFGGLLFSS